MHRNQLTRAVVDLDDHILLAAMPLAPHHSDHLSKQPMVLRCNPNPLDDAGIRPLLLLSVRYERRSTAITANQPFGAWGKVFPDSKLS
jgi:hypothetical protein